MDSLPIETRAPVPHPTQPKPDLFDPASAAIAKDILANVNFDSSDSDRVPRKRRLGTARNVRLLDAGSTLWVNTKNIKDIGSVNTLFKLVKHFNPRLKALKFDKTTTEEELSQALRKIPDVNYVIYKNRWADVDKLDAGFLWVRTDYPLQEFSGIRLDKVPLESPIFRSAIEERKEGDHDPVIELNSIFAPADLWPTALWGTPAGCDTHREGNCSPFSVVEVLDFLGLPSRKREFDAALQEWLTKNLIDQQEMNLLPNLMVDDTLPKTQAWFEKWVENELKTIASLPDDVLNDERVGIWDWAKNLLNVCANPLKIAVAALGFHQAQRLLAGDDGLKTITLDPPSENRPGQQVLNQLKQALGLKENEELVAEKFPTGVLINIGSLSLVRNGSHRLDGMMTVRYDQLLKCRIKGTDNIRKITPECAILERLKSPLTLTFETNWTTEDVFRESEAKVEGKKRMLTAQARNHLRWFNKWVMDEKLNAKIVPPSIERIPYMGGWYQSGDGPLPGVIQLKFEEIGKTLSEISEDFDWEHTDVELMLRKRNAMTDSDTEWESESEDYPGEMPDPAHLKALKRLLQKPMRSLTLVEPQAHLLNEVKDEVLKQKLTVIAGAKTQSLRHLFKNPEDLKHLKVLVVDTDPLGIAKDCDWLKSLPSMEALFTGTRAMEEECFSNTDILRLKEVPKMVGVTLVSGCEQIMADTVIELASALPKLSLLQLNRSIPSAVRKELQKTLIKPFVPMTT